MEINGFNNYLIYPDGKVFSKMSNKYLSSKIERNGYERVALFSLNKGKHFSVHRLVALHYINNPDNKSCVDHIDRNKLNNNVENLRWVTNSENEQNKGITKRNTSGVKFVMYNVNRDNWKFCKTINGKTYTKQSKNKIDMICYKYIFNLKNRAGLLRH